MLRYSSTDDPVGPGGPPFFSTLDADRYPQLAAIGGRWPELAARDSFPDGLRALVDGLLASSAYGSTSRPASRRTACCAAGRPRDIRISIAR